MFSSTIFVWENKAQCYFTCQQAWSPRFHPQHLKNCFEMQIVPKQFQSIWMYFEFHMCLCTALSTKTTSEASFTNYLDCSCIWNTTPAYSWCYSFIIQFHITLIATLSISCDMSHAPFYKHAFFFSRKRDIFSDNSCMF
jgi:hypothetical protein